MPLTLNLIATEIAGLIALWSVASDLRTGKAATSKTWTVDFAHNRIGFCLLVAFKVAFVAFAAAMLLRVRAGRRSGRGDEAGGAVSDAALGRDGLTT